MTKECRFFFAIFFVAKLCFPVLGRRAAPCEWERKRRDAMCDLFEWKGSRQITTTEKKCIVEPDRDWFYSCLIIIAHRCSVYFVSSSVRVCVYRLKCSTAQEIMYLYLVADTHASYSYSAPNGGIEQRSKISRNEKKKWGGKKYPSRSVVNAQTTAINSQTFLLLSKVVFP